MASLVPMSFALKGHLAFIPEDQVEHFAKDVDTGRMTIIGTVEVPITVAFTAS